MSDGLDFCVEPCGADGDFGMGDAGAGTVDHGGEDFGAVAALERFEKFGAAGIFGGRAASLRVEDYASADCGDWGKLADDEAIAREEQDFFGEAEMGKRGFAGWEFAFGRVVEVDLGDCFGCVGVEVDAGAMLERRGG